MNNTQPKEGQRVECVLVTGEKAVGTYVLTKDTTGSYLIEDVTTDDGKIGNYAWADSILSAN